MKQRNLSIWIMFLSTTPGWFHSQLHVCRLLHRVSDTPGVNSKQRQQKQCFIHSILCLYAMNYIYFPPKTEGKKGVSLATAARYRLRTSLWLLSKITTRRGEVGGLNEAVHTGITSFGPTSLATCSSQSPTIGR